MARAKRTLRWRLAALAFGGGLALALASPGNAAPALKASTCAAAPADAASLVPDGAQGVVGVDVAALTRSELFRAHRSALESQPGIAEPLARLVACGLSLDDIDAVTVAAGKDQQAMAVIRGAGIGKHAALQCLATKLPNSSKGKQTKVHRRGCRTEVTHGGKTVGWGLDDRTLVVASEAWADAVAGRIAGKGRSALRGNLSAKLGAANRRGTVWFAGGVDAQARKQLAGTPAAGVQSVAGSVDVGSGVRVALVADTGSRADAQKLRDELDAYLQMGRAMSTMAGIPARVLDGVRISAAGSSVRATAELSRRDIEDLRKAGGTATTQTHSLP